MRRYARHLRRRRVDDGDRRRVRGGSGCHGSRCGSAEPGARARRRDHTHFDRRRARQQHVELGRGGVGQVDDAIADERAAVVDAHHHLAAVAQVGDFGVGGNRQRLVRRRHGVHVVGLAQRRRRGVKARAVPGRGAALDVAFGAGHHVVALAEDFVERRIAALAARLGARHRIGNRRTRRAAAAARPSRTGCWRAVRPGLPLRRGCSRRARKS